MLKLVIEKCKAIIVGAKNLWFGDCPSNRAGIFKVY